MNFDQTKCLSCDYYESEFKECRKNPPVVTTGAYGIFTMFPGVSPLQWCGEWSGKRSKENPSMGNPS